MLRTTAVLTGLALGVAGVVPAAAASVEDAFPTEIVLPAGFQPEGIAIGSGPTAYFGSRTEGSLYRVDLRTGEGEVFSQGPGTPSNGLKIDSRNRLFVAGSTAGDGRVVDARTGAVLASYQFAESDTMVNDVVLTDDAAYFTDSRKAVLYRVEFGRNGSLPTTFTTLPLTGDFVLTPGAINANGIAETPDGRALMIVQTSTGTLFQVDPSTGVTREVDLGGEVLTGGDGLLVERNTLYVVQNRLNTVAEFDLNRSGTSGTLVTKVTDPRFDVPTTVASFGDRLYLPNARLGAPPTSPYTAVAIPKA